MRKILKNLWELNVDKIIEFYNILDEYNGTSQTNEKNYIELFSIEDNPDTTFNIFLNDFDNKSLIFFTLLFLVARDNYSNKITFPNENYDFIERMISNTGSNTSYNINLENYTFENNMLDYLSNKPISIMKEYFKTIPISFLIQIFE